ncbi:acyl carrier protein [Mesobacterium pallidum]|uniref:acyl carrier protein n=1 Tax=Mesobacterium pallidum TaxID=2872037 RepID=UPI001EE35ECE|nr:acyl carrier protein [Mesobacterium pallidum]
MSDTKARIYALLEKYSKKAGPIAPDDKIFGDGLNMASISFTEFVLEFEDEFGGEDLVDDLGADIKTAGQLVDKLASMVE